MYWDPAHGPGVAAPGPSDVGPERTGGEGRADGRRDGIAVGTGAGVSGDVKGAAEGRVRGAR